MGRLIAGVQLYTLREFCKTPKDIEETFKKIRKMGYKTVQISGIGEIDTKELKKLLDDNGLYACSTHTPYDRIVNEIDRVIEKHKILGCEAIICPGLPQELRKDKEGYLKAAREFGKVIKKIKKEGLILGYHNHGVEFERFDGKTGLEILLGKCKEMEAEIDTYWVQYGGGDPAYWIEKFSGRVSEIHVKDMGIIENKQVMPPIGDGNLNWERIVKACKKAKVRYCLVEMDTPTIDVFKALEKSLKFMKKIGIKP
ncbi:MAG TPA: sugar phosphate isomerase/epimerase [bacterium]|nr:sugar phosphate isomerase/epimerase [bacterium]